MRITTNNGTTISGSLSEVLATLSHLGVKAEATKPVTSAEVTETAVTGAPEAAGDGYVVALAPKGSYLPISYDEMAGQLAKLHAGETVMPKVVATPVPVPKPARDSVIKMAIADVEALLGRNHTDSTWRGDESNRIAAHIGGSLWFSDEIGTFSVCHAIDFAVNADKRTVVAIVAYKNNRKEISKGRAKCAPGDVFNEHIGKAIALRRALGLAVPVEYFEVEARDSDDLAVGDVVSDNEVGCDEIYTLTELIENPDPHNHPGQAFRDTTPGWMASSEVTLINDSARHTAPDLEVSRIIRH